MWTWKRSWLRTVAPTVVQVLYYTGTHMLNILEYSHNVCVLSPPTKKKKKVNCKDYLLLPTKFKEDTCIVVPYN